MILPTLQYRPLIQAEAVRRQFPNWGSTPATVWLEAIALHESSGNANAQHMDKPGWLTTSYGLFQIEGRTAQSFMPGLLSGDILFDPAVSLGLACKLLQQLIHQYGPENMDQVLAAYNGGNWGAQKNQGTGKLNDQIYVDAIGVACSKITQ